MPSRRVRRIAGLAGAVAIGVFGVAQLGSAGASVEVQSLKLDAVLGPAGCLHAARATVA